ncbi:unnamed protein product [Knipowitschia caucasica]
MAGSSVLNQRQHVGLQKLVALSGITTAFLGPSKTYKIIQDDVTGESTLVSSCHRLLQNLELTCAVGQLVYETVEAHHTRYKTGSGCLLFMAGAWARAALECLHRGIPIVHIISAMSEGMDLCLSVCKQCRIPPIELDPKQTTPTNVKDSTKRRPVSVSTKTHIKLKLSRHFQEPELKKATPNSNSAEPRLANIARTLSHGHSETMDLVVKASLIQDKQDLPFDIDKISTCLLPGSSESRACVLPGCVVSVCPEKAVISRHLQGRDLKVALINGDLTPAYRHLGYNKPKGLQRVADSLSSDNATDEWLERVVRLLLDLDVNILLISGIADGALKNQFWKHHILVVEKMRLSVLKTFTLSTGAILVSYATQLNSRCVKSGVSVNVWKDGSNFATCETLLNISTDTKSGLATVVLTSWVEGKLPCEEDAFWACAYRLHWALKDAFLLPGVGGTELLCIRQLQEQAGVYANSCKPVPLMNPRSAAGPDRGVVLQLMAEGLMDFVSGVMVNTGEFSKVEARTVAVERLRGWDGRVNRAEMNGDHESRICDNLSVKQEAWRTALDLVFLVLQTDAEIITGVGQERSGQKELMFL